MPSAEILLGLTALVIAIVGIIYARRAVLPPRRQLDVSIVQVSPILTTAHDKLTVEYDGRTIDAPHVCAIRIQSTGKHAISATQFDSGRPVVIDLKANVVENLGTESVPAGQAPPEIRISGTQVQIHPSVIAPGQTVDVSVLTAGRPTPDILYHLIDTKVEFAVNRSDVQKLQHTQAARTSNRRQGFLIFLFVAPVSIVLAVGLIALIAYLTQASAVDAALPEAAMADENFYYPVNGILPESGPDPYGTPDSVDHCKSWKENWTESANVVPVNSSIELRYYNSDFPVELVRVTPRVLGTFEATGQVRLRCSSLQRREERADVSVDLDHGQASAASVGPIVARPVSDSPPTFSIDLSGTASTGYEFALDITYTIDGETRTETFDKVDGEPLRVVFDATTDGKSYFDWDYREGQWVAVSATG